MMDPTSVPLCDCFCTYFYATYHRYSFVRGVWINIHGHV